MHQPTPATSSCDKVGTQMKNLKQGTNRKWVQSKWLQWKTNDLVSGLNKTTKIPDDRSCWGSVTVQLSLLTSVWIHKVYLNRKRKSRNIDWTFLTFWASYLIWFANFSQDYKVNTKMWIDTHFGKFWKAYQLYSISP